MNEPMTTDNCGVNPLLILRIVERSFLARHRCATEAELKAAEDLSHETFHFEVEEPELIQWSHDNYYQPEYDEVFNDRIPARERLQ